MSHSLLTILCLLLHHTGSSSTLIPSSHSDQMTSNRYRIWYSGASWVTWCLRLWSVSWRTMVGVYVCALYVCVSMCSGADKFSEIFLGEFDTPEAIWSSEMRWVCLCYSCSQPATPTLHCAGGWWLRRLLDTLQSFHQDFWAIQNHCTSIAPYQPLHTHN